MIKRLSIALSLFGILHACSAVASEHEPSHNPTSAHPETHQADHHASRPVIENWWSWTNRQELPPFGYALINFSIFLFILHQTAGKQLRIFLKQRRAGILKHIEEARFRRDESLARFQSCQEQLSSFEQKSHEMFQQMREQASRERQRTTQAVEQQILRLKREFKNNIHLEKEKLITAIKKEAAATAVAWAERTIRESLQPTDQKRLLHSPLVELERASQKFGGSTVSKKGGWA